MKINPNRQRSYLFFSIFLSIFGWIGQFFIQIYILHNEVFSKKTAININEILIKDKYYYLDNLLNLKYDLFKISFIVGISGMIIMGWMLKKDK